MRVPLSAARAARAAVEEFYHVEHGSEWAPKLYTGDHEEVDPDAWVISWEEGCDYEWVYNEDVAEAMKLALIRYAMGNTPNIEYRVEAINHWCMAVYAEPKD